MTNAISVKDRLKKQAIEDGKTMQDKLVTYGLERTIYRLSVSNYVERFTLKGGIFLYALFNGEYARATMDIDLLAQRIPNDAEEMKKVFNDIFSIECDDALRFDLNTLEVINITEFKEYHGVNVSIMGYLDRMSMPFLFCMFSPFKKCSFLVKKILLIKQCIDSFLFFFHEFFPFF